MNPYDSPADALNSKSDPLGLPAIGYMVLGALGVVAGLGMLVMSALWFWLWFEFGKMPSEAWETLGTGLLQLVVSAMFLFVSRSLRKRKNKWLIVVTSILGTAACIPAPVTVLTLMRICRKEVWRTFAQVDEIRPDALD